MILMMIMMMVMIDDCDDDDDDKMMILRVFVINYIGSYNDSDVINSMILLMMFELL